MSVSKHNSFQVKATTSHSVSRHPDPGPLSPRLILLNKPFQVLSQFSDDTGKATLARYLSIPDIYPAGRLDYDSEGLLILTSFGKLQHLIAHPKNKLAKTYLVQVEGTPTTDQLTQLSVGVKLKDGQTRPAQVEAISPPELWPRVPPIRERKQIPTSWLKLTISEGRNRQVRRMTAAVGLPTLRLVRSQIGPWSLGTLLPGEWRELPCPVSQLELDRLMK